MRIDVSPEFPLRGLVSCDECGEPLTAAVTTKPHKPNHKGNPYYFCQGKGCPLRRKSIRKALMEGEFEELLKQITLKNSVDGALLSVYDRVWNEEAKDFHKQGEVIEKQKVELNTKIKELTDMFIATTHPSVKRVLGSQIEAHAVKLEQMGEDNSTEIDLTIPYRTALDKSKGMLKSPYKTWEVLNVHDKQRLFYFIFDEKIPYRRGEGYRTKNSPNAVRLFEEFAGVNTQDVEMAGANPRPEEMSMTIYVRRMSHLFHVVGARQAKPYEHYVLNFCPKVGHTLAYPEKMTQGSGLSGVLPSCAAYLSVGESEIVGLKVRSRNSTGAFLGTFKLFA